MKRKIDYIVLHTTASRRSATKEGLMDYFLNKLGWGAPGYHWLIYPDGRIESMWPEEKVSNGVYGFNDNSIHVSWIGGLGRLGQAIDNRTPEQIASLETIVKELLERYPKAKLTGHHNFNNKAKKACPCFSVRQFAEATGIPDERVWVPDPYGMMQYWESMGK